MSFIGTGKIYDTDNTIQSLREGGKRNYDFDPAKAKVALALPSSQNNRIEVAKFAETNTIIGFCQKRMELLKESVVLRQKMFPAFKITADGRDSVEGISRLVFFYINFDETDLVKPACHYNPKKGEIYGAINYGNLMELTGEKYDHPYLPAEKTAEFLFGSQKECAALVGVISKLVSREQFPLERFRDYNKCMKDKLKEAIGLNIQRTEDSKIRAENKKKSIGKTVSEGNEPSHIARSHLYSYQKDHKNCKKYQTEAEILIEKCSHFSKIEYMNQATVIDQKGRIIQI